jgi:hypothetical protein
MGDLSRRLVHLYHASHRIFPSELEIDAVAWWSCTTPLNSLLPTFVDPEDMGDLSRRLVHLYHASHRIYSNQSSPEHHCVSTLCSTYLELFLQCQICRDPIAWVCGL